MSSKRKLIDNVCNRSLRSNNPNRKHEHLVIRGRRPKPAPYNSKNRPALIDPYLDSMPSFLGDPDTSDNDSPNKRQRTKSGDKASSNSDQSDSMHPSNMGVPVSLDSSGGKDRSVSTNLNSSQQNQVHSSQSSSEQYLQDFFSGYSANQRMNYSGNKSNTLQSQQNQNVAPIIMQNTPATSGVAFGSINNASYQKVPQANSNSTAATMPPNVSSQSFFQVPSSNHCAQSIVHSQQNKANFMLPLSYHAPPAKVTGVHCSQMHSQCHPHSAVHTSGPLQRSSSDPGNLVSANQQGQFVPFVFQTGPPAMTLSNQHQMSTPINASLQSQFPLYRTGVNGNQGSSSQTIPSFYQTIPIPSFVTSVSQPHTTSNLQQGYAGNQTNAGYLNPSGNRPRQVPHFLKHIEPPTFIGAKDSKSAFEFLQELIKYQDIMSTTDYEMLTQVIPFVMKGDADIWYRTENELLPISGLHDFAQRLRRNFQPHNYTEKLKVEFERRTQGMGEPLCSYIVKLIEYYKRLNLRIEDQEVISRVISRLNPEYSCYFRDSRQFATLYEFKRQAEEVDALVARKYTYRPPPTRSEIEPNLLWSGEIPRDFAPYANGARSPNPWRDRRVSFSFPNDNMQKPSRSYTPDFTNYRDSRNQRQYGRSYFNNAPETYRSNSPQPQYDRESYYNFQKPRTTYYPSQDNQFASSRNLNQSGSQSPNIRSATPEHMIRNFENMNVSSRTSDRYSGDSDHNIYHNQNQYDNRGRSTTPEPIKNSIRYPTTANQNTNYRDSSRSPSRSNFNNSRPPTPGRPTEQDCDNCGGKHRTQSCPERSQSRSGNL